MTDPFSVGGGQPPQIEWWHLWLAAVTAMWGGVLGYFRRIQEGHKHSWISAGMHLSMSGFAGLLCWLGCMQIGAPGYLTAICTGLAGHMGAEFIRILQKRFTDKVSGGNKDE
ncbi:TPA: phage holin family protein [Acinetobacter baumannii]|nr:phage holin family protein [Acinetobacter baumannii]